MNIEVTHPLIAVDASLPGRLKIALIDGAKRSASNVVETYLAESLPTLTDGLLKFAEKTKVDLRGAYVAIAIAGPVRGNTIPIARSRWTISRDGLTHMFNRAPVIINEVAATAWASADQPSKSELVRGAADASIGDISRRILISIESGLGGAIIDADGSGAVHVLASEAGHAVFSPFDDATRRLTARLQATSRSEVVTWEKVLMLERGDVAFAEERSGGLGLDYDTVLGSVLGCFAADFLLSAAAWDGMLLAGSRMAALTSGPGRRGFDAALEQRRTYSRLVQGARVWRIRLSEPVMDGLAAVLRQTSRVRMG